MPRVDCLRSVQIERTPRVTQLEGLFDIPPAQRSERRWQVDLPLEQRDWRIGLIVGPSGSGKSTLARELFGESVVTGYDWPAKRSLVDGFPREMGIREITALLSSVAAVGSAGGGGVNCHSIRPSRNRMGTQYRPKRTAMPA